MQFPYLFIAGVLFIVFLVVGIELMFLMDEAFTYLRRINKKNKKRKDTK